MVAFAGWHEFVLVLLPTFIAVSCMGFLNPNTIVGALTHHAGHAGSASALSSGMPLRSGEYATSPIRKPSDGVSPCSWRTGSAAIAPPAPITT